jgi:two-component system, NtrC family, response regulator HydG
VSGRDLIDLEEGSTARRPRHGESADPCASFVVKVVTGPDSGASFSIDASEPTPILIGQSASCAIRLTDPEVSRRHARLDFVANRLRAVDLDSTNGTLVTGIAIGEAYLQGGELVQLGGTVLRIERRTDGPIQLLSRQSRFGRVIGQSPEMRRLYPVMERLATSDVPVVIEGETGTGKEVLAEALHECGPRSRAPFVVFDCTTVSPGLMESELFGHERGAFTGAVSSRKGVFEQAHGGTLFIDEIGDLDLALQPKLLRAIERAEIRRVGSDHVQRVDVRVVAATRRDLDREVQLGRFRDDLYYRLVVGRIELPPLRLRREDIALLAQHFWFELGGDPTKLVPELLARWQDSPWPGNVRQLRNAVAQRLALGELGTASLSDAAEAPDAESKTTSPDFIEHVLGESLALPIARLRVVEEFERRYIARALEQYGGNVARAAEASGIARRYFQLLRGGRRR